MITISKIPDGKTWADAIAQYRSKGMRTNFYATAEEFLPQLQWLSELKFDGGCYLFHEKEKQIDLYFFLEQGRKAEQIPVFDKPVLLEQVGVTKAPPDLAEWEKSALHAICSENGSFFPQGIWKKQNAYLPLQKKKKRKQFSR